MPDAKYEARQDARNAPIAAKQERTCRLGDKLALAPRSRKSATSISTVITGTAAQTVYTLMRLISKKASRKTRGTTQSIIMAQSDDATETPLFLHVLSKTLFSLRGAGRLGFFIGCQPFNQNTDIPIVKHNPPMRKRKSGLEPACICPSSPLGQGKNHASQRTCAQRILHAQRQRNGLR